jgi:hypothetical protein
MIAHDIKPMTAEIEMGFQGCEYRSRVPDVFEFESRKVHGIVIADDTCVQLHLCDAEDDSTWHLDSKVEDGNREVLKLVLNVCRNEPTVAHVINVLRSLGFGQIL